MFIDVSYPTDSNKVGGSDQTVSAVGVRDVWSPPQPSLTTYSPVGVP